MASDRNLISNPDDRLCTIAEAGEVLRTRATKTWGLVSSGHLEVIRLSSRCTRVRWSSVQRLIREGLPGTERPRKVKAVPQREAGTHPVNHEPDGAL